MEYGVWAFILFRPSCKSIVFNPIVLAYYCAVFASTCIGVHSSILIMMAEGLTNFVGVTLV